MLNVNGTFLVHRVCISREALCAELLGALVRPGGARRATKPARSASIFVVALAAVIGIVIVAFSFS
jgi:hypothetical protein